MSLRDITLKDVINHLRDAWNQPAAFKAFRKWQNDSTIGDVYDQFLQRATTDIASEYDHIRRNALTSPEIENFDAVVSTFRQSPTGEIETSDLLSFLGNVHIDQTHLIHAARIPLTALVKTYARYPFSRPVPLTRDALLRATLFLTEGVNRTYRQAFPHSKRRVDRDWLTAVFKALIPNAGVGMVDYEEVADFLYRCPFPLPALNTFSHGNPEYFREMARRLDSPSLAAGVIAFKIPVDTLQAIGRLAASLLERDSEEEMQSVFVPTKEMELLEFIAWGTETQLLKAFDKLFDTLLQPHNKIHKEG